MPPRDETSRVSEANLTRRVIIALDTPDLARPSASWTALGDRPGYYKVGLELFAAEGPAAVRAVRAPRSPRVPGPQAARHFRDRGAGHAGRRTAGRRPRHRARRGWPGHAAGRRRSRRRRARTARAMRRRFWALLYLRALIASIWTWSGLHPASGERRGGRPCRMAVDSGCGGLIAAGSDARALARCRWSGRQDRHPRGATGLGGRARPENESQHQRRRSPREPITWSSAGRWTAAPDPAGAFERLME